MSSGLEVTSKIRPPRARLRVGPSHRVAAAASNGHGSTVSEFTPSRRGAFCSARASDPPARPRRQSRAWRGRGTLQWPTVSSQQAIRKMTRVPKSLRPSSLLYTAARGISFITSLLCSQSTTTGILPSSLAFANPSCLRMSPFSSPGNPGSGCDPSLSPWISPVSDHRLFLRRTRYDTDHSVQKGIFRPKFPSVLA